jgi:hypothetical protein
MVETLEARMLLAAAVVNSTSGGTNYNAATVKISDFSLPNAAPVTLRDAVNAANNTAGNDTISFDSTVFPTNPATPTTITLTGTTAVRLRNLAANANGTITISGPGARAVAVSGNSATTVFQVDSGLTAEIDGLTITGGNGSLGGGLSNSGNLTLNNDVFVANSGGSGGGIMNSNPGRLTIMGSTFSSNTATASGGGLWNSGTLNVSSTTFSDNQAIGSSGGGLFTLSSGNVAITASTFVNNSAQIGGGIWSGGNGNVTLTGSTIVSNSADFGGGVNTAGGNIAILSNTIADNVATTDGGGISDSAGTITLTSTIVFDNTLSPTDPASPPTPSDWAGSPPSAASFNLLGDAGSSGLSNGTQNNLVGIDPLLGPLASNGGPTQTMALLLGSPAINAGNSTLTNDQRGPFFARKAGPAADIGAFEDQLTDTTPVTSVSAAEGVPNTNVVLMTFTDGNASAVATDFTPVVDWGGTLAGPAPVVTVVANGTGSWKVVADSVAYAEIGTYTATVTVRDGSADVARTNKVSFAVADAPLTDTTSIVANGTEGIASTKVVVMTFTDANPFATASDFSVGSVNWGGTLVGAAPVLTVSADSSYSGPGSGWQVVADSVTYAEKNSYAVSLTVNDVDGASVSRSNTIFNVADASLSDTTQLTTANGTEGLPNTNIVLMTFTDANPLATASDFSVGSVNWAATPVGATPNLSVVADSNYSGPGSGWKVVADSVTYAEKNSYAVSLTVNDVDGASVSTSNTSFSIADAPLSDTTPVTTVKATEGLANSNIVLMTFTDANPQATASDFSVGSVNWGATPVGGTPNLSVVADSNYSGPGSGWKVVADSVTYAETNSYTVSLTVNDVDGASVNTSNVSFHIIDAALTDTTSIAVNGTEGLASTNVVVMTFTDANPLATASDFSVGSVNWDVTPVGGTPNLSVVADSNYSGPGSGWKVVADSVTYAETNNYSVSLTVNDADGATVSTGKTSFSIADAPLTDTTSITVNATAGVASTNVVVMTFTDANPIATPSDFIVGSVNWGATPVGGTPNLSVVADSNYSGPGSGWKVVADSVTYAQVGSFKVSLTVNDVDGTTASTSNTLFDVASGTSTSVVLTLSAPSVTYGQDGLVTVTVTPANARGTLSLFVDNSADPVGTQTLDPATGNGSATFDVGILAAGTHSLHAEFTSTNPAFADSTVDGSLFVRMKTITAMVTANDKIYDGTTTATVSSASLSGIVGNDDVSLSFGAASFASKNVGTWTVTVNGLGLSGAAAGNYVLDSTTAQTTATITPRSLDGVLSTAHSINIAKNGTITFSLSSLSGIVDGQTVADLFNGAHFNLMIGSAVYSGTSTASVVDGTIYVSWRMSQELYTDLYALLNPATPSTKTNADLSVFATSLDGNYCLSADVLTSIFQRGNVTFS